VSKLWTIEDQTVLYQIASRMAGWRGYELRPKAGATAPRAGVHEEPLDFTAEEIATLQMVRPHTMTSPERVISLIRAVEHITRQAIPGDIVECGVWRGGSMMAAARTLLRLGDASRTLHLFDTFEGMPPPTEIDRTNLDGIPAADLLAREDRETSVNWAVAGLDLVRANVGSVGYPADRVKYVVGKVEETIPEHAPERIALLRLDTDRYESTRHELIHLYPRLVPGGLLIVDDYGHWGGARRAVDEYLEEAKIPLFLSRIDYTGRIAVKV
jgi:O-methyltransferase